MSATVDCDECPICGGVVGADTCEDCLWRPGVLSKYLGPCRNTEPHDSHAMDGGDWTCPGVGTTRLASCATCWPRPCGEPPYRVLCRRSGGAS